MKIECYLSVFLCVHLVSAQTVGTDCTNIPTIPIHGHITYTPSYNYVHVHGTKAEYICDAGYTNDGPQIIIYCHDGEWLGLENDDPTRCVTASTDVNNIDCESPLDTNRPNMILTGSYRTGSTVIFRCVPGYYLHPNLDPPVSHCINGGWTEGEAPYCTTDGYLPSSTTTKSEEGSTTTKSEEETAGEDDPSSSTSTGVIVGMVIPILIIMMIIGFIIAFHYYKSERIPLVLHPPPQIVTEPWDVEHLRVIDSHEFSYAAPHTVLKSSDVTFGTQVDDGFENMYNATIRLEGDRQQNAVVRIIHGKMCS